MLIVPDFSLSCQKYWPSDWTAARNDRFLTAANVGNRTDVVDTRYSSVNQSSTQDRAPQDHMAFVEWWGVGCGVWGVRCGVWGVRCGVWGVGDGMGLCKSS